MLIEMNDYGCIVTSVCLRAFILPSAGVVKLEPFECARHRGGREFCKEMFNDVHGILLS